MPASEDGQVSLARFGWAACAGSDLRWAVRLGQEKKGKDRSVHAGYVLLTYTSQPTSIACTWMCMYRILDRNKISK